MGVYTDTIKEINKKGNQLNELLDSCIVIKNEIEELTNKLKEHKSEKSQVRNLLYEIRNSNNMYKSEKMLDDVSMLSKEYKVGVKEIFKYKMLLIELDDKISALLDISDTDIDFR